MQRLRTMRTAVVRTLLLIPALFLAYIAAAYGLAAIPVNADFEQATDGVTIYVYSNGIHTDIWMPAENEVVDWREIFPPRDHLPARPTWPYISVGWGELGLYRDVPTWDRLTVGIAARSMLWPTEPALHTVYWPYAPSENRYTKKLSITTEQYERLVAFVQQSYPTDAHGRPRPLNCCRYPAVADNFYAAHGQYHLFNTCNNWTNRALKAAGVRTSLWSPMHTPILDHLERIPPPP